VSDAISIIDIAALPHQDGFIFEGPTRKVAWSPVGFLSCALSTVSAWAVAAHPWDPWPNRSQQGGRMPSFEDERALIELRRLSAAKLAEPWTGRPAQKQVLANVLHGREVTKEQRNTIAQRMTGRPLSHLAGVVAEVLG
jgi:hypothetical protein